MMNSNEVGEEVRPATSRELRRRWWALLGIFVAGPLIAALFVGIFGSEPSTFGPFVLLTLVAALVFGVSTVLDPQQAWRPLSSRELIDLHAQVKDDKDARQYVAQVNALGRGLVKDDLVRLAAMSIYRGFDEQKAAALVAHRELSEIKP